MSQNQINYSRDVQELLIRFMVSDPELFARSRNIVKDEYFDDTLRESVRFILEYADQYKSIPTKEQVIATTGKNFAILSDINDATSEWYLNTIEAFCRYRAIENTILDGPEMLKTGRYAEIETRLKEAMIISLTRDLGSDYFADPMGRIERMRDTTNLMPTGWPSIDRKLDGGLSRGGLHIFCGGSGSGKSLWMANLALNKVEAGLNVLYITLELAEDLTDSRVDQMVTGMSKGDIFRNAHKAAALISARGRETKGTLTTKKFPEGGTNCNDLRAYLKEYRIKKGFDPDLICVDYLDLLHPNNSKIDVGNLFVKDKFVSEELRSIAGDLNVPVVTASQLNRQSVEASEFDHAHIAGGISKINTADNVFAILFNTAMRERGEYELQFLKTRSSASVGHHVKLKVNKETLRITDLDDDGDHGVVGGGKSPSGNDPSGIRAELHAQTAKIAAGRETKFSPPEEKPQIENQLSDLLAMVRSPQKDD